MADGAAKQRQVDETKLEFAIHPPAWVDSLESPAYTEEIKELLEFFLAYSPCRGVSARGVSLARYGWSADTPKKGGLFAREFFAAAGLEAGVNYFTCTKREEELDLFQQAEMDAEFHSDCRGNRVALISSGNLILDIFKAIRNAIAHFRFCLVERSGTTYIAMENGVPKGDRFEVKARIFLSIDTLGAWVDLAKSGKEREAAELQRMEDERKALEEKLYSAVLAGEVRKADDSAVVLGLKKSESKKILMGLKNQKRIEYSNKQKRWIETDSNSGNSDD